MKWGIALVVICGCAAGDNWAPPPAELVGTWRYMPKLSIGDVPVAERQVVRFDGDGKYEIRSTHGDQDGVFRVDDSALTIDPGGGKWITTGFAVTEDRLIVDALFPVGDVDGTTGTWEGSQRAAAGASTETLVLADDGTAALAQTGPGAETLVGTWTHVGADVVFTYPAGNGTPIGKHYQEVVGVAVGEWMYERVIEP